jgi:hypothetical protein
MSDTLAEALRALLSDFRSFKFGVMGDFYDPRKDRQFTQADAALASYEAAPGPAVSDDFAAGMRRAAEIARAAAMRHEEEAYKIFISEVSDRLAARLASYTARCVDNVAKEILSAIPAASPAPWMPPDDRADGFRCLGWLNRGWHSIYWYGFEWFDECGDVYQPIDFRPLPSPPATQRGDLL